MNKKIIHTRDGSSTIAIEEMAVTYHSIHGALTESKHVFIEAGFDCVKSRFQGPLKILEVGLGTGLNAWLTAAVAMEQKIEVVYDALEPFPLNEEEYSLLQFPGKTGEDEAFNKIHVDEWEREIHINPYFLLRKYRLRLQDFSSSERYHCIYFDAFAPSAQPELWTEAVFSKLFKMLEPGGILVTYCSKSIVRKAMVAAGFRVEKLQGPPGKREIVRSFREGSSI